MEEKWYIFVLFYPVKIIITKKMCCESMLLLPKLPETPQSGAGISEIP